MSNGKVHGKQIKDTSLTLDKLDLSGAQGTYLFATGSYLGAYEVPNIPQAYITKEYADSISSGLDPKESVRVISTSNINLYGTQSIDGYVVSVGDRVLVISQTSSVDNGIYSASSTTWSRASDSDGTPGNEVSLGNFTFVEKGLTYSASGWLLYNSNTSGSTVSVGVETQLWTQFNGAGNFIWGDGLANSGNNIYVDIDPNGGLTFSSTKLTLASYLAGNGLTLTSGVLNVGAGSGISSNANDISIDYSTVAQVMGGAGLTANGNMLDIGAGSGITVNADTIAISYSNVAQVMGGAGLTANGNTFDILVIKGVTFSGDYLFSDADTILTTTNLPNVSIGTNSSIQSALTAIDSKLTNIGAQEETAINGSPTQSFPKTIDLPKDILGTTFSYNSDGVPHIYINGAYVYPTSSTSSAAFFSVDAVTASQVVFIGSKLWLNPYVLGYKIDPTDSITIHYLTKTV